MPQLGPNQQSRNRRPRRRGQIASRGAPVTEYEEQQELEAARERNDLDVSDLREMSVTELRAVSRDLELETGTQERKDDLVERIERDALARALDQPDEVLAAATDDAGLVEQAGGRVHVVESPAANLKVTTPTDLRLAEILLNERR